MSNNQSHGPNQIAKNNESNRIPIADCRIKSLDRRITPRKRSNGDLNHNRDWDLPIIVSNTYFPHPFTAKLFLNFRLLPTPLSFDAVNEGDAPRAIGFTFGTGKTRMTELQSGEGRTTIDSVVWAQYINVTDRHTDSHVAIANAAPTHGVGYCRKGGRRPLQTCEDSRVVGLVCV